MCFMAITVPAIAVTLPIAEPAFVFWALLLTAVAGEIPLWITFTFASSIVTNATHWISCFKVAFAMS